MHDRLSNFLLYVIIFCFAVSLGFFLLSRARRLFLFIKPELLRRNVVTFLIGLCFFFALGHLIPDFTNIMHYFGWLHGILLCGVIVLFNVILPYNIILYLTERSRFSTMDPVKLQPLLFFSIVICTIIFNGIMNYWFNGSTKNLAYSVLWSFYLSGFGAIIYLFLRHQELEKKKKLYEKELEVARLNEQKTKAELEALHSKINPHFLYNVLNSIADLSITDGEKARSMTIALADLFRYSMNYNGSNYARVKDELDIAKLYLEIEKIRFEDRLIYSIQSEEQAAFFLVPKFILQPLMENGVKHGLKATGKTTVINLVVMMKGNDLVIHVYDNGPAFPADLNPGYGLKSVFEKLDLLFPGKFEIKVHNEPRKYFELVLYNPVKNEPADKSSDR